MMRHPALLAEPIPQWRVAWLKMYKAKQPLVIMVASWMWWLCHNLRLLKVRRAHCRAAQAAPQPWAQSAGPAY